MIIECPNCESKVDAIEKGEVESLDDDYGIPTKVVLVECPICKSPILGDTDLIQVGREKWDWRDLTRVWPNPDNDIDGEIPDIARNSLLEARMCYKAKAYSACAVMSGRAIEGVCLHHSTKKKTLAGGLKELKDSGAIDKRLFEWGDELRKHRNIGAHATDEKISREDAKDLLDFAAAICEYVFVLNAKFLRFQERIDERDKK